MGSDASDEIHRAVAEAIGDEPRQLTLELSRDRFGELGRALDTATEILERRGYRLARVRGEEWGWVATYEPVGAAD